MIKLADKTELARVADMGEKFAIEGSFPMAFHKDHWCGTWSQFMDLGVGVVLVDIEQDVLRGAIGGYVSPDVCDGAMTLHEGFWYVYQIGRAHV